MQLSWLQHQLAARGVRGDIATLGIVCATRTGELYLDVELMPHDDRGKPFVIHSNGHVSDVAREHHVLPIGGLVLQP